MANNLIISGTTYNGVEQVVFGTAEGGEAIYLPALKLPDYYAENDYLATRLATVRGLMDEAGNDGVSFVLFTDSHMELAGGGINGGNSGKLAYQIMDKCQIPRVLYLGDANSNSPQESETLCLDSLEAFNAMVKPLEGRIAQILGNHDGAWGLPVDGVTYPYNITRQKLFNRALQKNRLGETKVFGPDGAYFYIDDHGAKTRFILLNTSDKPYETNSNGTMTEGGNTMKSFAIRQAQVDWLIQALNVPDGWYVVSFSHPPLHPDTMESSEYIRGLLAAYQGKTNYTATYTGKYGKSGYTNLYDVAGEGYSLSGTTLFTNYIPCTKADFVHFKSSNNRTPYKVYLYTADKTQKNTTYWNTVTYSTADYDSSVTTYLVASANGGLLNYDDIAYIRFEFRSGVPTDLVITVNENIEGEASDGTNWDALTIDADFSGYKGDYIAHFCGHAHNDYHYTAASFGIDMVSVACDGRVSNCAYMEDEAYQNRALGTIYEQVVDAVVINKAARTIKTVRFGAGSDREIGY